MRVLYLNRPLSEAEISKYAPAVLNDLHPSKRVTEKYAFFPTINIIKDMRIMGWLPFSVEQRQVQDPDRKDVTKHMVIFRNLTIESVDHLLPEIILTNSHDGRNSFRFYAGMFHSVKQMSYVVYEQSLEEFKVKHQGYTIEEVKAVINKVLQMIPDVYDKIILMKKIHMNRQQKIVFAMEAVKQRWKEGKTEIDMVDIVKPIREDEHENNLWNLFSIVQEKIVSGGVKYEVKSYRKEKNGKKKEIIRKQTARALVNIDQKIDVKKSLWKIASDIVISYKKKHIHETVS